LRGAGEKPGRVVGKNGSESLRDSIGEIVFRDLVPDRKYEMTARFQNPARFLVSLYFVGKKHDAELTRDDIEALVAERQRLRIGLFPFDPITICARVSRLCIIKHWLIEVGCDDTRACRKPRRHRACQNAGTCGCPPWFTCAATFTA
jgi:hypothetical protein